MEQEIQRSYPPVRRRRKIPKWKRMLRKYWPPIRMGLIVICLVSVLTIGISAMVNAAKDNSEPRVEKPNKETTAETTEATISAEDMQLLADACLEEAAFIAAGYDYEKAISMLKAFEHYDQFPQMAQTVSEYEQLNSQLVSYPNMDQITHVFFHSLIVDTNRAFDGEFTDDGYNLYMTTIAEFEAMLEQMYQRGYVLVTPYDVAKEVTDDTGTHFAYCDLKLPAGKIPFIMSQDDVNYYGYMISNESGVEDNPVRPTVDGDGFAHRLVVGSDGYPTCEYMDANGNVTTGDYDLVPVLEKFIQAHPDFAYHGARAVLGVTGYEGVLGYRTKPAYEAALGSEAYQKEIEEAKKVADCLKEHGWILASHSYGHPAYGQIPAERVEIDSDKWEATCEYIVGAADIILYPHGSDIAGVEEYTFDNAKFNALYNDGYRYFFNVDSSIYWSQLGSNYFRGGRRNLDGYRMYHNPDMLNDLFDTATVFDKARPTPVPSI